MFEKLTVIFLFISSSAFLSIRLCIIPIRWGMGQRVNYPGYLGRLLTHHFQGWFLCSKCLTGASESRWPCSSCADQHSRRWTGLVDNWHSKSCLEPQPNWRDGSRVGTNPGIGMQSSPKRPGKQNGGWPTWPKHFPQLDKALEELVLDHGLPRWCSDKASTCQCRQGRRREVGKIPWRRKWQPTPVFLPGELHGQRSLACCSPRSRKESLTIGPWPSLSWSTYSRKPAVVNYCSLGNVKFTQPRNVFLWDKGSHPFEI